jgi:hypothetical protein
MAILAIHRVKREFGIYSPVTGILFNINVE